MEKVPHAEEAYGYSFEKLVLYAWSLGIGTTWIGGTMKRELFEKAAGLADGSTWRFTRQLFNLPVTLEYLRFVFRLSQLSSS